MADLPPSALSALVAALVAAVWYFLRKKDVDQEKQIDTLFAKYDAVIVALQNLRVDLARDHYQKPEVDAKILRIEEAIEKSMDKLGDKFDKLSAALLDHIQREDSRDRRGIG